MQSPKFIRTDANENFIKRGCDVDVKEDNNALSSPIPLPALRINVSPVSSGRDLYYA